MKLSIFYKRIFTRPPAQIIIFLILSLLPILMAEATEKETPEAKPPVIILEQKDQGKEIKINLGEVVGIKLKALGSAGYQWHFDDSTFKYFELIEYKTEPTSPDQKVGAAVWSIWSLKSIKAGAGEIRMDYFRIWEGRDSALDHFTVKVNIEGE